MAGRDSTRTPTGSVLDASSPDLNPARVILYPRVDEDDLSHQRDWSGRGGRRSLPNRSVELADALDAGMHRSGDA